MTDKQTAEFWTGFLIGTCFTLFFTAFVIFVLQRMFA